ncbi:MAG TPA: hypothetical protein VFU93_15595, partial [Acidimicrobiales bacterium]|nr:hypothetical protein [Acidimicrobiales bacterium]
ERSGVTIALQARATQIRDEAAYMVCGLWMIIGLYIDGWSHQVDKPETFFTPWHFVLYSGFGAAMLYSGYMAVRDSRLGVKPAIGDDRITTLGIVIFVLGAVGDGIWHELIGIEVDIEGLISPTHLALMVGGLLMVTLPVRSARRSTEPLERGALLTVLASVGLALAVVSFFLMYLSPWTQVDAFGEPYVPDSDRADLLVQRAMAMVLVTTALFTGAVLWAARHWRLPAGTATVMFTAVAIALSGLDGFDVRLPVLAATAAGLVADALLGQGRSFRVVGMVTGGVLWAAHFGLNHLERGVEWSPSLWSGAILFSVMTGLAVGLATSAGTPARDA